MNLIEKPILVSESTTQPNQYVKGQIDALKLYFTGSENALGNIPDLETVLIKINDRKYTPLAKEVILFVNTNKSEIIARKKTSLAGNTPLNEVDELLYQIAKANSSFKDTFVLKDIFEGQIAIEEGKEYPEIAEEDRPIIENEKLADIGKRYMSYNNSEERVKPSRAQREAKYIAESSNKPTPPSILKNPLAWLKNKFAFWNNK